MALLTAAFASGEEKLLRRAMQDRMHQPFREAVCPLLSKLLPLSGEGDVLGVALSGAGPSVLLLVRAVADRSQTEAAVRRALQDEICELLWAQVAGPAQLA